MLHLLEIILVIIYMLFGTADNIFSQTVPVMDSFSDGDFTSNPTWTDSESKFIINSAKLLQLNDSSATSSNEAVISTPSTAIYGEWEAFIKLSFNPSGSNLCKYYVLSDTQSLKEDVHGYYIQIGGTDDEVNLYRQDGNSSTKIIDGTDGLVDRNPVAIRIKVSRDINGNWELFADSTGGNSFISQGTVSDQTYVGSSYIGLFCNYTITRSTKFQFDDIKVTKKNPPLRIKKLTIQNRSTFDLMFNISIDPASVDATDFSINNGADSPASATVQSSNKTVRLTYKNPLSGGQYTLTVNNIDDSDGNTIMANSTTSFTLYDTVAKGDVIINEFVYDPASNQSEYVELKNTTGKYLTLRNWQLGDKSGNDIISTDTLSLPPNDFLVISDDTTTLASTYGSQRYVEPGSTPAFNNSGDIIKIRAGNGTLVDSLQYTSAWGGNNVALERRSDNISSVYKGNFGDSPNALAGTPGQPNEVADDTTPPDLAGLKITNDQTLDLKFNERLANSPATNAGNFTLNNGISVSSATQTAGDRVCLQLSTALKNGRQYQLTINNQQDIFTNTDSSIDTTFSFYVVSPPDSADIFINEFLYHPPNGRTEYIELYNPTSKSFDLNGWTINDNRGNPLIITKSQYIVPPDSFVVIAPDNSLHTDYSDIQMVAMGTNFPSLNNSGDAIVLRDSTGHQLDSLTYTSDFGGDEVALERRTTEVAPTKANFGDAPNGFGTPGSKNKIGEDTTPPKLQDFTILNHKLLEFVFTEQVTTSSATNKSNYEISDGFSISSLNLFGSDTVRINLSAPLNSNTTYTTTIEGVKDIFGNAVVNRDTSFTYFKVSPADSGDTFINEFLYDPPAGQTEYIELYNPTTKSLDLQNWSINDNTGNRQTITKSQYILPPDAFVILAPDKTVRESYPNTKLIAMRSRFPSLNNSGDDIVLRDSSGVLLDSLRYTPGWGGDNMALERRTTAVYPLKANFGDAPSGFGTPGSANDIPPDDTPPSLTNIQIIDPSTIQLTLSETVTGATATDRSNYHLSPRRNIQLISSVQDTVTLILSQALQSGQHYDIKIRGLKDLFGNIIKKMTTDATYIKFTDAKPGNIIINEFLYTRESAGDPEFIELYNPTDQNFDLSDWQIGDARGTTDISSNTRLRAGRYLVFTDDASFAATLKNSVYLPNFPSLNNDEDAIYIQNEKGITIDSLYYHDNAFGGIMDGKSAERLDPKAASNDPANFAANTTDNGSTPGAMNSVFKPDTSPPVMNFSRITPNGNIEIRFSEFISLDNKVKFSINDQSLSVISFNPVQANTIILNIPSGINQRAAITLTAKNLADIKGNTAESSQIQVAQLLTKSDVVVNEILYDPLDNADDNKPDQNEYVELRNTQDYAISLEGIRLHDAPDEDGNTHTLMPVSTSAKFIPAQGTALIYAGEKMAFNQSRIAQFFGLSGQPNSSLMRINRSTLSLASSGDAIYLADSQGVTIDSVFYDESWQNPNLIDTKGIALERINPKSPGNDASNWGSSTDEQGGTPNKENTIYQASGQKTQQHTGISFSPNPFSPDDDGTDDRLFINYKLDNADYLLTVRIYDRYGRLVRELADSKPAGFTGSLIWDGRKDNGSRNRIGIYIVIFKAFNSAEGRNKAFKKTVVLARRLN